MRGVTALWRSALVAIAASGCGHVGFDTTDGSSGSCASRTFDVPALSTFTDDFAVTPLDSQWMVPVTAECIAPQSGSLVARPAPSADQYCLAFSTFYYHLTCDSVTVEVPVVAQQVLGAQTVLYLDDGTGRRLEVILEGGGFQWTPGELGAYDATADRWWRLRERDGEVAFDTSPDGIAFTTMGTAPDPISLDHVELIVGAGNYRAVADPGTAAFRCLGLGPPCQ